MGPLFQAHVFRKECVEQLVLRRLLKLKGKIRLRQREDEKYYAVKTLRFVNEEEVVKISERKKAQQSKAHHPSS